MSDDMIAAQYQGVLDLKQEVDQLFHTIRSNQEEAPMRSANLAKMKVEERLEDLKLYQQEDLLEIHANILNKSVNMLEELESELPDLITAANSCQEIMAQPESCDESCSCASDETEALLTKVSTSNVNNQNKNYNKTPTQEEANLAEFMSIVHQAKAGKSRQDLQEQKISIIKTQGNKIKKNEAGLMQYKYTVRPFSDEEQSKATTIIMLGESGSGKSTFMSTILNVVTGVEFDDSFRFILVPENTGKEKVLSQTKSITEYRINAHNGYPPIILIDTPGFGDTEGFERDQASFKKLAEYLKNISYVHAVCMVAKSSANRLSVFQKYIFDNVFSLFGKDVIENFICILTFCDIGQPQILEALQSDECDLCSHIPNIQPPWYLAVNNAGMTCKNNFQPSEQRYRCINEQHFETCKEGINQFFAKFYKLEPKTLKLTKQQLEIQDELQFTIESLTQLVFECETDEQNIQRLIQSIRNNEEAINSHQNFMIEQDALIFTKEPIPGKQKTTTCLACNKTCHENCLLNDNWKRICIAMGWNGICRHCGCIWSQHNNVPYLLRSKIVKKEVKIEDMFEKFTVATEKKNRAEGLLQKAEEKQMEVSLQCLQYRDSIAKALRKLKSIALKKVDNTSTIEYIQLQIKTLEAQKPENFERKVAQLKGQQKRYQNLQQLVATEGASMQDLFSTFHCNKNGQKVDKLSLWRKAVQLYKQ